MVRKYKNLSLYLRHAFSTLSLCGVVPFLFTLSPLLAADISSNVTQEQEADTLLEKGIALGQKGDDQEALTIWNDLIHQFENAKDIKIQREVARAFFYKVTILFHQQKREEVIAVSDEVVRRFGDSKDLRIQQYVVGTLGFKADVLGELRRYEEALTAYDDLISRFGKSKDLTIQYAVARALIAKGNTLGEFLHRYEEGIETDNALINNFESSNDVKIKHDVAWALHNKGISLARLHRYGQARAVLEEFVRRFKKDEDKEIQKEVASTQHFLTLLPHGQ